MRTVGQWLDEYGESHRHPINKTLHWICVPPIVLSVIGLIASIPVPEGIASGTPWFNWAIPVAAAAILYYAILSVPLALGMLPVFVALFAIVAGLGALAWPLWASCLAIFVIAWIGQFVGHVYEGRRPSFFTDVFFLLIGPLWLLAHVYRRLGIAYSREPVATQR